FYHKPPQTTVVIYFFSAKKFHLSILPGVVDFPLIKAKAFDGISYRQKPFYCFVLYSISKTSIVNYCP
ncbi:hypothetical protein, partial [Schaedlerella sp.]|uniref:hypothetical protein n=1 Tax=Schaedlerella sp. TaxID=2676057 RepID=UPI0037461B02